MAKIQDWYVKMRAQSSKQATKLRAVNQLCARPNPALMPELRRLLDDPDAEVRRGAVQALSQMQSNVAIKVLVKRLSQETDAGIIEELIQGLGSMTIESVLPMLLSLLGAEDLTVRQRAASALSRIAWTSLADDQKARIAVLLGNWEQVPALGAKAIPAITTAILDGTQHTARLAAESLAKIGTPDAVCSLTNILLENSVEMPYRKIAAWALQKHHWDSLPEQTLGYIVVINSDWDRAARIGSAAIPALQVVLHASDGIDDSEKAKAAKALSQIDQVEARRVLCEFVLECSPDFVLRELVFRLIPWNEDPHLHDYLVKLLGDSTWRIRQIAALEISESSQGSLSAENQARHAIAREDWDAVSQFGATAVEPLMECLRFHSCANNVAKTLCNLGEQGVEALAETLRNPGTDAASREVAVMALANAGDTRAIDPLVELLRDDDMIIRQTAAWALERIGWQPNDAWSKAVITVMNHDWAEVEKAGMASMEPLLTLAQQELDCDEARGCLKGLLERSAPRASLTQLKALAALPDLAAYSQMAGITTYGEPPPAGDKNTENIRTLAKRELYRRGILC